MKYRFLFLTTLLTITTISWAAEKPQHDGPLSVDEHRQWMQQAIERCNTRCSGWSDLTRRCFSECIQSHALQAEIDDWKRATSYCGRKFASDTPEPSNSMRKYMYRTMVCSHTHLERCVLAKMEENHYNRKAAAKKALNEAFQKNV